MTGLNGQRVYLDWNATAPLRPEARTAMLEAMDVVGNPSSVHAEGRAAKAIVEKARMQVAALTGHEPSDVIFTSGTTEAIAMVCQMDWDFIACTDIEHEAVLAGATRRHGRVLTNGEVDLSPTDEDLDNGTYIDIFAGDDKNGDVRRLNCLCTANGETGVVQDLGTAFDFTDAHMLGDATQAAGKIQRHRHWTLIDYFVLSAHKIGGPKGVGALIAKPDHEFVTMIPGGGQERGRRSGTENIVGIAGFGAAAKAAQCDLDNGAWEPVEQLRNILEATLAEAAPDAIFFGKESSRLPNTSCFAVPGWQGETQVMQMDLSGFAISAGSACSSGKVNKASRVLLAMGFDEVAASSAIRVSMGPTTTEAEVMAFADAWKDAYRRRKARAA